MFTNLSEVSLFACVCMCVCACVYVHVYYKYHVQTLRYDPSAFLLY